jgi:adenylate cyclase
MAKMLYAFEGYTLDTDRRELRNGHAAISIQPQVFDLLEYLVRNRDRVVSRDDLIASIWGGRIVSESTLATRINSARAAIGDNGAEQRLISTLPRRGIRFIGAVQEQQTEIPTAPLAAADKPPLALPDRPSVAVLPFVDLSGNFDQEYFVDGLTEDIITSLSKWQSFFVIARNSTFVYKGRAIDVRQVSRELGVRYVLEGSARKAGNRVRISAQLIDAISGAHVWAERFDQDLTDVFSVQDELTQHVAAAIGPAVSKVETERARRKTPEELVAWDHYLRGMWYFHRFTEDGFDRALISFRRAVDLDETLAHAHAGIARTCMAKTMYRGSDRERSLGNAIDAAKKALSLDGESIDAYYALSLASAHSDDIEVAFEFAQRATRLNENFAPGYFALAVACVYLGRPTDGLAAVDRALRLNPTDPQRFTWLANRASALYLLGRYAQAIECARHSLALGRYHTAMRVLAASYAQLDMTEKACDAVRELLGAPHGDKTIAAVVAPFRRSADREIYAKGLGRAGMPEA